jgi:hypothetical protein
MIFHGNGPITGNEIIIICTYITHTFVTLPLNQKESGSPTHKKQPSGLKFDSAKTFGELISELIFGVNRFDMDIKVDNLRAKPVIWNADVFGARR